MVACQRDEPADPVGQTPVAVSPAGVEAPAAPVAAVEAPDDGDAGKFDPESIPVSTTTLGDFPYLKLPTGYRMLDRKTKSFDFRSEEHTSELQSLMRISYAVFCLKTENKHIQIINGHI